MFYVNLFYPNAIKLDDLLLTNMYSLFPNTFSFICLLKTLNVKLCKVDKDIRFLNYF